MRSGWPKTRPRVRERTVRPTSLPFQSPAGLEGSVKASIDFILRRAGAIEQFSNHPGFGETTLGELLYQSVFSKETEPLCVCLRVWRWWFC